MSKPYFSPSELDFLSSLHPPTRGFLIHFNCGTGAALDQWHQLGPDFDIQGVETSSSLREQFSMNQNRAFSYCLWSQEHDMDPESFDVLHLSGVNEEDLTPKLLSKGSIVRYWELVSKGGLFLVEADLVNDSDTGSPNGPSLKAPRISAPDPAADPLIESVRLFTAPDKKRVFLAIKKGDPVNSLPSCSLG